jgi:hypothetical protein
VVFRGFEPGGPQFLDDPLGRFDALDRAFEPSRSLLSNRVPQRLAAADLVLVPGDPAQVSTRARALGEHFASLVGLADAPPTFRVILGAIMLRHGDTPEDLAAEAARVRPIIRRQSMRWSPVFESIAIIVLRLQARGPIAEVQLVRMHAIYEAMKRHHWFLTGPDDFPTCALLSGRPHPPSELAERAHRLYELLRSELRLSRGDPLQTVSNILALADAEPEILVARYGALVEGFERAGQRMVLDRYDDLALLCFLPRSTESIVQTVVDYDAALRERFKWHEVFSSFTLATNLAFVHVVGNDPELGPLADVKALLDMSWIVQQSG